MSVSRRQVDEIVKCGKNPDYFFNTYCKIQHPTKGLIPFKTFPFQDDCVEQFVAHRLNIILKARQLGISTLVAAFCVWLALFHKDQNLLIIATKQSVAQNIVKKVKIILNNLPKWLILPRITGMNKQAVEFSNGSTIKAVPTSDDAGRSEAISLLIIDEAAFIRNFDELWTGLYPTLSTGGRAIILSTPKGVGGQYHKIYTNAEAGLNEFNSIKLPWNVHPERDQAWFENETRNFSKRKISQEYLCDFLASGDTMIDATDIAWVNSMIAPPRTKFAFDRNGWEWKIPLSARNYVISADIARGDGKDYSTFHVIDTTAGEVVAEYKGKLPPDQFADLLFETGIRYNKALLVPESNTYGYHVCAKLKDAGYPRLYYHDNRKTAYIGDYIPPQDISKAGFPTTSRTRNLILAKLEELIRNRSIKIYSSRFYDEMKQFIWSNGKAQAQKGANDDLVMSLAIGSWFFDGTGDYAKYSNELNQAMLNGMGINRKEYKAPEVRGKVSQTWDPFLPVTSNSKKKDLEPATKDVKKISNTAKDLKWLY